MDDATRRYRLSAIVYRRLCLATILLIILSACGAPTTPAARKKLTIAWVSKSRGNPVFDLGQHGAMQKARELTDQGPVAVEESARGILEVTDRRTLEGSGAFLDWKGSPLPC